MHKYKYHNSWYSVNSVNKINALFSRSQTCQDALPSRGGEEEEQSLHKSVDLVSPQLALSVDPVHETDGNLADGEAELSVDGGGIETTKRFTSRLVKNITMIENITSITGINYFAVF